MHRPTQRIATFTLAAALAGTMMGVRPCVARGETYEELHQRVVAATSAYEEALAQVDEINAQIAQNEERIAQIESELPEQQQRTAAAMRSLYKMQQSSHGLVDVILSSDSFNHLISTVTYLEHIEDKYLEDLTDLVALRNELQEAKDTLNARKAKAKQDAAAALAARDDARGAREAMYLQYVQQAIDEREEAQAALERAAKQADQEQTFTTASGNQAQISVPEEDVTIPKSIEEPPEERTEEPEAQPQQEPEAQPQQEPEAQPQQDAEAQATQESSAGETMENLSDSDAFVNEWAGRIDDYLAGSPLEGYGATFAEAAYANGVDPRVSPAIATIESGQGSICFRDHNAWGWGSSDWDDWESAIWDQVSGYADNYGSGVTYEGAQTYCPPTADEWYSSVTSEMENI